MVFKTVTVVAGRVVFGLSQWVLITLATRLSGLEAVGQLGLALAICTPLSMLFGLSLRSGIATDIDNRFSLETYLRLRTAASVAIVMFTTLIALVFFRGTELILVIISVACVKSVEGASELSYGVAQRTSKITAISRSYLLRGLLSITLFGGILYLAENLLWAIWGWFISGLLVYIGHDLRFISRTEVDGVRRTVRSGPGVGSAGNEKPSADLKTIGLLVVAQIPLSLGAFLGNLSLSMPRLFLDQYSTLEIVGVFTSIFFIFQAANMILQTLGQLAATRLSRFARCAPRRWLKASINLAGLFLSMSAIGLLGVYFFGSSVLRLLYGPQMADYNRVFVVLALAWTIRYVAIALKSAILSFRSFKILFAFDLIAGVVAFFCLYLGVDRKDPLRTVSMFFGLSQVFYLCLAALLFYWIAIRVFRSARNM